jgi:hypothetical protein
MNRKVLLVAAALVIAVMTAHAQERTVGLMFNKPGSSEGYTLFTPMAYTTSYLINNDGNLVHSWIGNGPTYMMTYLGADGYLYRAFGYNPDRPGFSGVEKIDWDGNVVWHYVYEGKKFCGWHDIYPLPNGNVLILAHELKDSLECAQAGANIDMLLNGTMFADYLVEVQPVGDTSGNIVWEWHTWDHWVQNFDSTKNNYGVPADHPELLDINSGIPKYEFPHLNSLDYNPKFDQIITTSFELSELYVIDHSTTTEQARGHTGGKSGKGGDFLYRWGNPQNYGQGTVADRKLFVAHSGRVVPGGYPGAGNFQMEDNGVGRNYSSAVEIVPPVDTNGTYHFTPPRWGPDDAEWTYIATPPESFYTPVGGSVQPLPNGNVLVCNMVEGEFFEVTRGKEMVWLYVNPVNMNGPVHQGTQIQYNFIYKIFRYTPDYAGLVGKDLTPKGPIELPAAVEESKPVTQTELKLAQNPFTHSAEISYQLSVPGRVQIKLYNALGQGVRTLVDEVKMAGTHQAIWDGSDNSGKRLSSGVYFCTFQSGKTSLQKRIVLVR